MTLTLASFPQSLPYLDFTQYVRLTATFVEHHNRAGHCPFMSLVFTAMTNLPMMKPRLKEIQ